MRHVAAIALLAGGLAAAGCAPAQGPDIVGQPQAASLLEIADQAEHLADAGGGVELARGVLIEDDGPAFGLFDPEAEPSRPWRKDAKHPSDSPYFERITLAFRARKTLVADVPACRSARLWIFAAYVPGASPTPLRISVNGHETRLEPPAPERPPVPEPAEPASALDEIDPPPAPEPPPPGPVGPRWWSVPVPGEWLTAGENEVVLYTDNELESWRVLIAPAGHRKRGADRPALDSPRSHRSPDAGATWSDKLGPDEAARGEYAVRLWLDQHQPIGRWLGPIVDLGAEPGPIARRVTVTRATVSIQQDTPAGTRVAWQVRSGTSPRYERREWGGWQKAEIDAQGRAAVENLRGRFVQVSAELLTDDPGATPRVRAVNIAADDLEAMPAPAGDIRVLQIDQPRLRASGVDFGWPTLRSSRLSTLARRVGLAEAVRDCRTQFEEAIQLQKRLSTFNRGGLFLPDWTWNSLGILSTRIAAGPSRPLPYEIAMCQLLQARGVIARLVLFAGPQSARPLCEFYSNDYRRWVAFDAHAGRIFLDARSAQPLDALELHRRARNADIRCDDPLAPDGPPAGALGVVILAAGRMLPADAPVGRFIAGTPLLVPRSDWLTRDAPLPLSAGWQQPGWTGYLAWDPDATLHRRLPLPRTTARANDWTPPINQVRTVLTHGRRPGELDVRLLTDAPGFKDFLVSVNDSPPKPWPAEFRWRLAPGPNALTVRARNAGNALGPAYHVRVNYLPPPADTK